MVEILNWFWRGLGKKSEAGMLGGAQPQTKMVEGGGDSAARSGEGFNQYSTADYCESPDSTSVRRGHLRPLYRQTVFRCPRKCYRLPVTTCCHQPKATHSFPNRRAHRSGGRRAPRKYVIEETTSMDDHKSNTSYSSMLTVDVSREMEAVNRDIEDIIRRCDHYCRESIPTCCLHSSKKERGLTGEQVRIVSMKRPPLEMLKEVPLCLLKPRPPRHILKERSLSVPHTKHKTSRDIRDIVEETDALLRNVYKELSKGKRMEEDEGCRCDGSRGVSEVRHATCLERYLGSQNKCRRLQHNRWLKPKWKEIFEKCELDKLLKGKAKHDTNCMSEPTSSYLVQMKKETHITPKTVQLVDAAVNTDTKELLECRPDFHKSFRRLSTSFVSVEKKEEIGNSSNDHKCQDVDLQSVKAYANYVSDHTSGTKASYFKSLLSDRIQEDGELFENRTNGEKDKKEKDTESLLLDRNMGLTLKESAKLKPGEGKLETTEEDRVVGVSREHDNSPDTFLSYDYSGVRSRSGYDGGGDSMTGQDISRMMFSQVISKIVMKPPDWTVSAHNIHRIRDEADKEEVDSDTCLEIMKRLVDLMSHNHRNQIFKFGEVPHQYARVSNMKQQHLMAILKEINSIKDLEFYLKNASVARTRTSAS